MQVNISFFLDEHGWSSCRISSGKQSYEFSITHAFPEGPIKACIDSLISIMQGEKECRFNWYSEPGGDQVLIQEIPTEKHKVFFRVFSFHEDYGEKINNQELFGKEADLEFEIKKIQLIRMFYFGFKKIYELLKDRQFASNREYCFPDKIFLEFEMVAKEYIQLK